MGGRLAGEVVRGLCHYSTDISYSGFQGDRECLFCRI